MKQMSLREVRDELGQRVDAAHFTGEPTTITKNGKPRAVLMAVDNPDVLAIELRRSDWQDICVALAYVNGATDGVIALSDVLAEEGFSDSAD